MAGLIRLICNTLTTLHDEGPFELFRPLGDHAFVFGSLLHFLRTDQLKRQAHSLRLGFFLFSFFVILFFCSCMFDRQLITVRD